MKQAWKIDNTRLYLILNDGDFQSLGLMMKYKLSEQCKLICSVSYRNNDVFSACEILMKHCEKLRNKYEYILNLIDDNKYEIIDVTNGWTFPTEHHDVEANALSSFFNLRNNNENFDDYKIKLFRDVEGRKYCACVYQGEKNKAFEFNYIKALQNGIKQSAIDNLKCLILACGLYTEKLQKKCWDIMVDHSDNDHNIMYDNANNCCMVEKNNQEIL